MKVVHVVPSISEEASGPSYSVVRLCESLIAQGQDVTLAALDWASTPSLPPFLKAFPLGLGPRRLGRSPVLLNWLARQAESRAVDLIHNHSLWMMPNVYPGRVARKHGIPLVVSPRGTMSEWAMQNGSAVKHGFWPLVQKPALTSTTCFHATAEAEYEDIRRMGFRQPVCVIPNGIDILPYRPAPQLDSRTLLFLGRIHPIKGVDVLIQAWKLVSPRFPEWRLQIAGPDNGGYLQRMQGLAAELDVTRIEFSGPLYGEAKYNAYSTADLFVLPTYSENFGMTVAEALAAGVPVIVTKGAPWSDVHLHDAGWWIDIGLDPLVACLENALAHAQETLRAMGERGREWMQAEFSWPSVAQKMIETYRWILDGAASGTQPDWVRVN